jgi:hypothetical protein
VLPTSVGDVPRDRRMIPVAVAMMCGTERIDLKKRRERCQFENKKFLT